MKVRLFLRRIFCFIFGHTLAFGEHIDGWTGWECYFCKTRVRKIREGEL